MLSVEEIKRAIDDDIASTKKRRAAVGVRYYEGKHDILDCRLFYYNADKKLVEDTMRSNIKIPHPFFTELADQFTAFMLSFKENPVRAKDNADGLQDHLDFYFDDEFWDEIGEMLTGAYVKGFDYLHFYKADGKGKLTFQEADGTGVVEIRAKDADDGKDHVLYWYIDRIEKGRKIVRRIQDWTEEEVFFYVQEGESGAITKDMTEKHNPRPHIIFTDEESGEKRGLPFGRIPFIRFDNCKKQISGLQPVKSLIDDYDRMQCGLSNNLVDFDTPLMVVRGFDGDNLDELQQNLKTKKLIGVDDDGGVDVSTVDIPYQARKMKADEDEKNIYRAGFGFNSSQVGDGNITNVVIQSRYTLLELKATKCEKRLRRFLKQLLPVVLDEINGENGTDYQPSDIRFDFTRSIMTNESENIANAKIEAETQQIRVNTILNCAASIGDEQTLKAICEVMDFDFEELQGQIEAMREEQNTADARAMLDGMETDEIEQP